MLPKISFVTPMKEKDFRVIEMLKSIRSQNYPQNKIEIIIIDGGSNPEVLQACKEYKVKIYDNPKQLAEGAGMGKDQGIWKSKGELIVISESDIEYIEKDWIRNMIKPFKENKNIFATMPKLFVHPRDNVINRYLSYVGVDPFAIYRSLEGQLGLGVNLKEIKKKGYFLLKLNKEAPFCFGSNGFMFKRELINEVGDYAQDVEFIARLANANYCDFAVVENASVWHKNVGGLYDFIRKRIKWTRNYSKYYVKQKKDFNWITNKKEFFFYVLKNMLIFPQIPISISRAVYFKDSAWLFHAPLMFFSTGLNIYFTFNSNSMWKQVFG